MIERGVGPAHARGPVIKAEGKAEVLAAGRARTVTTAGARPRRRGN